MALHKKHLKSLLHVIPVFLSLRFSLLSLSVMHTLYSFSLSPSLHLSFSAGIGRTGAFCALSTAIERVKAEGIVDVFHTIKHLRTQRPHMVQTVVS